MLVSPPLTCSTMQFVSDSDPFDNDDNEFNFMNMFGSGDPNEMMATFMQLLGGGGAGSGIDNATQIAVSIASGGATEPNVDPIERIALEQLIRVAELQVAEATGLRTSTDASLTIAPVTKADWVRKSMQPLKPLLEQLAASMTQAPQSDDIASSGDPQMAMFEQMFASMRPMMVSMTTGSMVGHIATKALGTYDLPIPRSGTNELLVVVSNLTALGAEWSLDSDELKMWIVLSEVAHHSVLSLPHVAEQMNSLIGRYSSAFRNDPTSLNDALSGIDMTSGDPSNFADIQKKLQEQFGDPSGLLNSMRSPEQNAILPEISALSAVIVGYVDHIMDSVGTGLISSYGQLTEAVRRRRVTTAESDRFVERLLGLELDQGLYDRGSSFVDGIAELGGKAALTKLWESAETLPTPNEIGSPGLWLSRMGIEFEVEVDAADLDDLEDFLNEVESTGSNDEEE